MEPLTYLASYDLVACCGQGRLATEVANHLRTAHKAISAGSQRNIIQEIGRIPGLIRTQDELTQRFQLPQQPIDPILALETPI